MSKHNPDLLDFVTKTIAAHDQYHYVVYCFEKGFWVEETESGERTATFLYPEGVDVNSINQWWTDYLDLVFEATDYVETGERQKVYWLTIFRRGETGGERPHKMKSPQTPFRTT